MRGIDDIRNDSTSLTRIALWDRLGDRKVGRWRNIVNICIYVLDMVDISVFYASNGEIFSAGVRNQGLPLVFPKHLGLINY